VVVDYILSWDASTENSVTSITVLIRTSSIILLITCIVYVTTVIIVGTLVTTETMIQLSYTSPLK
jgi:hypothetical protein